MTAQSKTTLKTYFNAGDKPTESQFSDLIDSFTLMGNNEYQTAADQYLITYPGASGSSGLPYMKAEGTGNYISMAFFTKGRDGSGNGKFYFYDTSATYGDELMLVLEPTGVAATMNRYVQLEPGFSSTGQFPSIRSMSINSSTTDQNIPFGILACGTGYVGFHTHGGNWVADPGGIDVLQCMVADTPNATGFAEIRGGTNSANVRYGASSASNTNQGVTIFTQNAGSIDFVTDGVSYNDGSSTDRRQARITHTANAVNYISMTGAATGNLPFFGAAGSDTDISLGINSQGGGSINFYTNFSTLQFIVSHLSNTANYLQVTGGVSGGPPQMSAQGSDTDVDIYLNPKGAGTLRFGTYTASGDAAVNGYITIKDANGNTRKLATIA